MSKSSNKVKADFLGMPVGTAYGRLRKNVMLHLLKELGRDACYRCQGKIEDPKDLSIEHKEEWLHESEELFWDLDNISFSHLACNSRARRYDLSWGNAIPGKERCSTCEELLPLSAFHPMKRKENRRRQVRYDCIECGRGKLKDWRGKKG